jgi:membrane protease YdiL (CAAX protease family)
LRAGWRIAIFVAALAGAMIGGSAVSRIAVAKLTLPPSAWIALGLDMIGAVSFAILFLAARFVDRRGVSDFGFRFDRRWWIELAAGLAVGAAMMAVIFAIERLSGFLTVTQIGGDEAGVLPTELTLAFLAYIGAALVEEVVTRAYPIRNLIEGLASWLGTRRAAWIAIILPGVIFGALHYPNPGSTPIGTLAVAFAGIAGGAIYVLSGQIAIVLGVHIAWNFTQGSIFGFAVSGTHMFPHSVISIDQGGPDWLTGGAFGPEAGAIGVGTWALIAAFFGWRHRAKFATLGDGFVAPPAKRVR